MEAVIEHVLLDDFGFIIVEGDGWSTFRVDTPSC